MKNILFSSLKTKKFINNLQNHKVHSTPLVGKCSDIYSNRALGKTEERNDSECFILIKHERVPEKWKPIVC